MTMNISFEEPFHGVCTSHRVILHSGNSDILDFLDLKESGIAVMPNVLILDGKRFRYCGVVDGMGQYRRETK